MWLLSRRAKMPLRGQTKVMVMADRAASVHSPFHRVPRSVCSTLPLVSSFILRFHVHTTTPPRWPNSHNDCHTGSPATFPIPQTRRRTIPTLPVFASVRLEKGCALEATGTPSSRITGESYRSRLRCVCDCSSCRRGGGHTR